MHNDFQLVEEGLDEFPQNWEMTYITQSHKVSSYGMFHPYSSLLKFTQENKAYGRKKQTNKQNPESFLLPGEIWSNFLHLNFFYTANPFLSVWLEGAHSVQN